MVTEDEFCVTWLRHSNSSLVSLDKIQTNVLITIQLPSSVHVQNLDDFLFHFVHAMMTNSYQNVCSNQTSETKVLLLEHAMLKCNKLTVT